MRYILIAILTFLSLQKNAFACGENYLKPFREQKSNLPGIFDNVYDLTTLTSAESGFFKKVEIIENALPGSIISLKYFIYEKDITSSYLSSKLIEAGARGVKVNLLVDYFSSRTNQSTLAFLASHKNIEVRAFAPPKQKFISFLRNKLELTAPDLLLEGIATQKSELVLTSLMSSPKIAPIVADLAQGTHYQVILSRLFMPSYLKLYPELLTLENYSNDYLKRLHHKWLGAQTEEGYQFIIGGRNVSDEYHVGREELKLKDKGLLNGRNYPFIDSEVSAFTSKGELMQERFDALWNPGDEFVETIAPLDEQSPLFTEELANYNKNLAVYKQHEEKLKARLEQGSVAPLLLQTPTYYSENYHTADLGKKDIIISWKSLIESARVEDGAIEIISAYLYLYPELLESLGKALGRGVPINIYTNSSLTTDLSMINIAAYGQIENWRNHLPQESLLKFFELDLGAGEGSLHAKMIKVGNIVGIGSANKDPRSYLQDTNNVLFMDFKDDPATAQTIFDQYLSPSSGLTWSELTPDKLRAIKTKLDQDPKSKAMIELFNLEFFERQL